MSRLPMILLSLTFVLSGCASKLNRVKKNHKFPGREIDLSAIQMENLETGEGVNLRQYMETNKLQYLLLMYGSVGCGICNKKAVDLAENFEGKHELLLNKESKHFDLIGVNTDTGNARKRFNVIISDPQQRSRHGYDFVKWADPAGEIMQEFFLEKDEKFGVPFAILLGQKGAYWSLTNDKTYTVKSLLADVQETIDGDGDHGDGEDPPDPPIPPTNVGLLSLEIPERLDTVGLKTCDNQIQTMEGTLTKTDLTFVQIDSGKCADASACRANLAQFDDLKTSCTDMSGEKALTCQFITLSLKKPGDDLCTRTNFFIGGKDFYNVFETHFNWRYEPIWDEFGDPASFPSVTGPIVLGFKRSGKLIYSHEGTLPAGADSASIPTTIAQGADERSKGANFPLFGELTFRGPSSSSSNPGDQNFASVRQRAKYTVVSVFDRYCGGCIDELADWSGTGKGKNVGNLVDFCEDTGGFCQIYALEYELARPNTAQGRLDFFNEIKTNFFTPKDVRVPLLMDTSSIGANKTPRIFYGYMTLIMDSWLNSVGNVIYDREGKIVANFKGLGPVHPDPVFETLKKLWKEESLRGN